MLFVISGLASVLLLTGCGRGLSGQATGGNSEDIEALKQEISAISTSLAELSIQIEQTEETIEVLDASVADLARSEAIEVLDASVSDLARSIEQVLAETPDRQPPRAAGPAPEKPNDPPGRDPTRAIPDQAATSPILLDWHLHREDGEDGIIKGSESGSTYAFELWLWSQPSTDAVLSIESDDKGEVSVSPGTLTFTSSNWETGQTVTLTGVDDTEEDGDQTTTVTVSGVGDRWLDDGEILKVVTEDDESTPTPTPAASATGASVFTSEDWSSWANGTYTKCTGIPCGALDVATWNGEPLYVKPSGVTNDPEHHWYWAYVSKFRPSPYFSVWTLAYVAPRYDPSAPGCAHDDGWCWNVHTACWGCSEPWGAWGNVTVTAVD